MLPRQHLVLNYPHLSRGFNFFLKRHGLCSAANSVDFVHQADSNDPFYGLPNASINPVPLAKEIPGNCNWPGTNPNKEPCEYKEAINKKVQLNVVSVASEEQAVNSTSLKSTSEEGFSILDRTEIVDRETYKQVKLTKRKRMGTYGVTEDQLSPRVMQELKSFMDFMLSDSFGNLEPPLRKPTAKVYTQIVKQFIGWYLNIRKKSATTSLRSCFSWLLLSAKDQEFSLKKLLPEKTSSGARIAHEYILFLRHHRGISGSYEANVCRAIIKLAKFLYQNESKAKVAEGAKPYSDLDLVKSLRQVHKDAQARSKSEPSRSDESLKWLDWPTYLNCVDKLKSEYVESIDKDESAFVIATKFQNYLISAIFAYFPDRQRTIRELEMGRTLIVRGESLYIVHGPEHYKTGKAYGARPPLQLQPDLTELILEFYTAWRKAAWNPEHSYLFCTKQGRPLKDKHVYDVITKATYRITGQKCNPHLLRDSVVTHVKGMKVSEQELEALALMMGHSRRMQTETYDKRTKEQKIAPAMDLLKSFRS